MSHFYSLCRQTGSLYPCSGYFTDLLLTYIFFTIGRLGRSLSIVSLQNAADCLHLPFELLIIRPLVLMFSSTDPAFYFLYINDIVQIRKA